MTITYTISKLDTQYCISKYIDGNQDGAIPIDENNCDYVQFLQYLVENGDSDVTGESVPSNIQQDADDWLFNKQLRDYVDASTRLELDAVVASDDIPETIDVTTTNMETGAQTTETVKNPLIVEDEEQRAAAQAVVDATPQPVIDSLNN